MSWGGGFRVGDVACVLLLGWKGEIARCREGRLSFSWLCPFLPKNKNYKQIFTKLFVKTASYNFVVFYGYPTPRFGQIWPSSQPISPIPAPSKWWVHSWSPQTRSFMQAVQFILRSGPLDWRPPSTPTPLKIDPLLHFRFLHSFSDSRSFFLKLALEKMV